MSPEVLIYIQNVRNFIKNDDASRNYFLSQIDEELFFSHLSEISQKNFEKDGEAMLTQSQFENLRNNLLAITITKKQYEKVIQEVDKRVIFDTKQHGLIFLN